MDPSGPKNQELLPPIDEQLAAVTTFIDTQLGPTEAYKSDGYDETAIVEERRSPILRLANGGAVYCGSNKTIRGEGPNDSQISVHLLGKVRSLYINQDGTYDFSASDGSEELFEEYGLSLEEAIANPHFLPLINFLYSTVTTEVPKPRRVFEHFPLPVSVVLVETQSMLEGLPSSNLEVGYAELPLKGNDTALIDNTNRLYGVFDGIGESEASQNAARLAATVMQKVMNESSAIVPEEVQSDLVDAIEEAQEYIVDRNHTDNTSGGTTLTAMKIVEFEGHEYLIWGSVGDSRLYIKNGDNQLYQVTEDESQNEEGKRNNLTNSLGTSHFKGVKQSGILKLEKNWEAALVTDGITGDKDADLLSDSDIEQAVVAESTAQEVALRLIEISKKHDDKMVVAVRRRTPSSIL